MVECKQDMPPPGGYAPITYKRVPLKRSLGGVGFLGIGVAVSAIGFYQLLCYRDRINLEKIEMRCSNLALRPMLEAENDRAVLKQLKRNRDAEERIMKDVKGWEVGKWKDVRVYLSLGPDEFFQPSAEEFLVHADWKPYLKAARVLKEN